VALLIVYSFLILGYDEWQEVRVAEKRAVLAVGTASIGLGHQPLVLPVPRVLEQIFLAALRLQV